MGQHFTKLSRLMPLMRRGVVTWVLAALAILAATAASGQTALSGEPLHINRTSGAIRIDGRLDDDGWRDAARVEKWYEINPGDNIEPNVGNLALLAYDDRYFYAAFEFADPDPSSIRARLGSRRWQTSSRTGYFGTSSQVMIAGFE